MAVGPIDSLESVAMAPLDSRLQNTHKQSTETEPQVVEGDGGGLHKKERESVAGKPDAALLFCSERDARACYAATLV